jgi:hypothetical protein
MRPYAGGGIILDSITGVPMSAERIHDSSWPTAWSPERRRLAMWIVLSVFAALLAYFGFRGYLSPELLFQLGNSLHC